MSKCLESYAKKGFLKLLEIKDSDIRMMILEQGRDAVDKGLHSGGAFSAVVPMVSLFYGGFIDIDVENPTSNDNDIFILSKGHAVATLASIYCDLGFFDSTVLYNSRSVDSILNGHPGALLPGVHISTGPEGHGMPTAQGFALAGKKDLNFDVYCLTGDGELQAGMMWEAVMYAGANRLDNFCVLVDKNEGQLDNPRQLLFSMDNIGKAFGAFGWNVHDINGTSYSAVVEALNEFKTGPRNGKPTVIICNTKKGYGGFSSCFVNHKITVKDDVVEEEIKLQKQRREQRVIDFFKISGKVDDAEKKHPVLSSLEESAKVNFHFKLEKKEGIIAPIQPKVRVKKAKPREKEIFYKENELPAVVSNEQLQGCTVVTEAMKAFAKSGSVVSIDSDISSASGLFEGISYVNSYNAFNTGIAESNMMCIGEAFAVLGFNTWVSTFCPFFDWRVMRRIAVNYQERKEVIESGGGWLSEGHNLDLTFLATASNFDTKTNGATHMGNDDSLLFGNIAFLKIIDTSCPRQLLQVMKWIMEGNKGLVYLRMMRAASEIIYDESFDFEYGKGYWVFGGEGADVIIISSGRQVHESIAAAKVLSDENGIKAAVVDMPSSDERLFNDLANSGKLLFFAEQNNGFLWSLYKSSIGNNKNVQTSSAAIPVNCRDHNGKIQYIHSATYEQLLDRFDLSPEKLSKRIKRELSGQ